LLVVAFVALLSSAVPHAHPHPATNKWQSLLSRARSLEEEGACAAGCGLCKLEGSICKSEVSRVGSGGAMAKTPEGSEIAFTIDGTDELDAYLDHVEGAKVVFVVQVNQA